MNFGKTFSIIPYAKQIIKEFSVKKELKKKNMHTDRNSSITEQVGCLAARSMKYFHFKVHIRILGLWEFPNYISIARMFYI